VLALRAAALGRGLPPSFLVLGVFLVLCFVRFVFGSWARFRSRCLRGSCLVLFGAFLVLCGSVGVGGASFGCAVVFVAVLAWLAFFGLLSAPVLVGRVLRRLFFVRFARPRFRPSGAGSGCWCCVPAGALSVVRSRCFVWSVRPAVVRRRLGVVLFFWVWASPTP